MSPALYNEYFNCESFLYKIEDKNIDDNYSSDGEFDDIKDFYAYDNESSQYLIMEYLKLAREKFAQFGISEEEISLKLERYKMGEEMDQELLEEAKLNV